MNNEIKMRIITNENVKMKVNDSEKVNMDVNVSGKEVDPIFRNSPAYEITYNDINYWNNKSNFSGNYNDLRNKPIIPTRTSQLTNDSGYITKDVSNLANYTLSTNLSLVATTGLYNDLLEKPTIPTDTSDLTNNAGFVTASVNNLENYTLTSNLSTVATTGSYTDLSNTPTLANVATTGLYDDLLNKPTLSTVASTGDYDDLLDKPTIPTKTSDLNNDSGFITKTVNDLTNYTLSSSLSSVATSGNYNDLTNKPTIPTKTSELTNDSGFVTNVYSTSETVIGTYKNKPLYRIVIDIQSPQASNTDYVNVSSLNIKKLVHLYGHYTTSSGIFGIPLMDNSSTNYSVIFLSSAGYIRGRFGGATNITEAEVVIEYTKTTD